MIQHYKNDINLTPCTFSTIEKAIEQCAALKQFCYSPSYFVRGEINNGVYINYDHYLKPPYIGQKCNLTDKICVIPERYADWDCYESVEFDPYNPFNDVDVLYVKPYDANSDFTQLFIVFSLIKP